MVHAQTPLVHEQVLQPSKHEVVDVQPAIDWQVLPPPAPPLDVLPAAPAPPPAPPRSRDRRCFA
jgi:hypothetical protein